MFSCLSFTRRNTKESKEGSGTSIKIHSTQCDGRGKYHSKSNHLSAHANTSISGKGRRLYLLWPYPQSVSWGACVSVLQPSGSFLCWHNTCKPDVLVSFFFFILSVAKTAVVERAPFHYTHSLAKANSSGESSAGSPSPRDFSLSKTCGKYFSI